MLCEYCHKKEACLHATKIENHQIKHLHLCEDCARAAGFDLETGMVDLQKLTSRWGADGTLHGRGEETVTGVCPQCGTESSELQKGHPWPGCPRCYEVFPEELLGALKEFQGGLRAPVEWISDYRERLISLEQAEDSASLFTGLADEATGEDPAFEKAGVPERSGSPARPGRRGGVARDGEAADAAESAEEPTAEHEEVHGDGAAEGDAARDGGRRREGGRRGAGRRSGGRARDERRKLEAALEEAIREERYEEAAELRDRLKELEGGTE